MTEAIALLYQALASPRGIMVSSSDVHRAKARLYQARAKAADPDLSVLEIRTCRYQPDSHLWITKKAQPNGTQE